MVANSMKSDIRSCILSSLVELLDHDMAAHGFTRAKRSLIYKRVLPEAIQKIDIRIEIHPADNRNAAVAIYPFMEVQIPKLDALLEQLVTGDLGSLEGITAGLSRQPIEFTSAKEQSGRWFLYQAETAPPTIREIGVFLNKWTIPFLDMYASPKDIIETDVRDDRRMVRDRAQMMRVVAAAMICERYDYAAAVLDRHFGATSLRKRHQRLFERVRSGTGSVH